MKSITKHLSAMASKKTKDIPYINNNSDVQYFFIYFIYFLLLLFVVITANIIIMHTQTNKNII